MPDSLGHPAYAAYARWLRGRPLDRWPSLGELNEWAVAAGLALPDGRPLAFIAARASPLPALEYERRVALHGEIATRAGNLHDLCNAMAWLAFPRTKAALNAVHVGSARSSTANARNRCRDAATLLDESGLIVACADAEILEAWRFHRWREAFWDRREERRTSLAAAAIGHGLIAKLAAPFRGITGRALVVPLAANELPQDPDALATALDTAALSALATLGIRLAPADLLPLPVAALPGWDTEKLGARLFDDTSVFRNRVLR
jgi:Protein of unknown function (DUF3025)